MGRLFFVFIILFIISPSNDSTIQGHKSWINVNEIPFSSSKLTWKTLAKLNNKILHLLFLNWQKWKWRNWLCLYTKEQKIFFFIPTSKNESTESFSLWEKVFCIGIATVMAKFFVLTAISQTYSVKIDTLDQNCETTWIYSLEYH